MVIVASQKSCYFVDFPAGFAVPVLSCLQTLLLWEALTAPQMKSGLNCLSFWGKFWLQGGAQGVLQALLVP